MPAGQGDEGTGREPPERPSFVVRASRLPLPEAGGTPAPQGLQAGGTPAPQGSEGLPTGSGVPSRVGVESELDRVVEEVVGEAQLDLEALRPEERQYLKEHALRKPMGVRNIW